MSAGVKMRSVLRVLGFGAVLLVGEIGAAAAADVVPLPPPPLPPPLPVPMVRIFSWTGFYIGGNVGWDRTTGSGTFTTARGADPFTVSNNNSFLGGAQAGYNWQVGSFVLGAETDFQGATGSGSLNAIAGPTVSATAKMPWFGTVRGRVGYAIERVLVYATGGAAYGDSTWNGTVSTAGSFSNSSTFWTWTAGAGVEMAFGDCWSAKVEYLYMATPSSTPTVPTVTAISGNANTNIVRAGINYHF
jgi:outer membrane immunogenic protein